MESNTVRAKIADQIQKMIGSTVIKNRRFLDDEQLLGAEQLNVLEEIFNTNVRDAEIKELSSHFAGMFHNNHPCHIAIWGKTGTGKTLTVTYFLNILAQMCQKKHIPVCHKHLDLSNRGPCFRALNDLACLLNASKRYKRGISHEEMMASIERKLASYKGYLILFIDEVDNVSHDKDIFLSFLIRRLPQRIASKLILVLVSNRLDWPDQLDPRVKSFLKMNELIFKPYDAMDLQRILSIRVEKALHSGAVVNGVIEKIAAIASQNHGDARKAVILLAKSAYLAEKAGSKITLELVDQATEELERDRHLTLLRTAPKQFQAAMAAVIESSQQSKKSFVGTGDAYEAYKAFCTRANTRYLTGRVFGDLLAELDLASLVRSRILSRGRYGRTREINLDLPQGLIDKIYRTILDNFGVTQGLTPL